MVNDETRKAALNSLARHFENHPRFCFFNRRPSFLHWATMDYRVCMTVQGGENKGGVCVKEWLVLISVNPEKHSLEFIETKLSEVFDRLGPAEVVGGGQ